MSDAELARLQREHPNLHDDVVHGTLLEASSEFVKAAEQYPVKKS